MILQRGLATHSTLDDLRMFLEGNSEGTVRVQPRAEAYAHVGRVLRRFSYWRLQRAERGLVRCYLGRTTGLSLAQLARLLARYRAEGELVDRRRGPPSRSGAAMKRRTSACWPRPTRCTSRSRVRPHWRCCSGPGRSSGTSASGACRLNGIDWSPASSRLEGCS